MNIEEIGFLEKFALIFDDTPSDQISIGTNFRELDEWSSMAALSLIAMADEEYNVRVTGDEIKRSNTVEDIYNLIKNKIG
jgi:acyl carrier protein